MTIDDEPPVVIGLGQEPEEFGCKAVRLSQSADEALRAIEESRPDLALTDLHIAGTLDDIQTA